MPQTFPVPTSDHTSGFSLIEVIVATAVTAMAIAAATTTILASQKVEAAAGFYRDAFHQAEIVHTENYGLTDAGEKSDLHASVIVDEEIITADAAERVIAWNVYTIRSRDTGRRLSFSIHTGAGP